MDLKVFTVCIQFNISNIFPFNQENLLNKFVHPYSLYPDETAAVDQIQIKVCMFQCLNPETSLVPQYECCGSDSYRDWARPGAWQSEARGRVPAPLVPDSCCKSPAPGCSVRDHPSNIHYTGCRHRSVLLAHYTLTAVLTVFLADSLTN